LQYWQAIGHSGKYLTGQGLNPRFTTQEQLQYITIWPFDRF